MLKRLEKLKTSIQNYVANNKFKLKNILKGEEWKFVSLLTKLLESFYIVTQQSSKNQRIAVKCNPTCSSTKKGFYHKAYSPPGHSILQP